MHHCGCAPSCSTAWAVGATPCPSRTAPCGHPQNHCLSARILNKLGRIPESTAIYHETLHLDPEHAEATHNTAVNRLSLGQHVRRNIGIALIRPLRWTTLVALLAYFAILCHEPASADVARVVTAVLVGLLTWVLRMVPRAARVQCPADACDAQRPRCVRCRGGGGQCGGGGAGGFATGRDRAAARCGGHDPRGEAVANLTGIAESARHSPGSG